MVSGMDNVTRFSADNRFSIIPHWVIFSGISSGAIHLYAVLAKYADNDTGQAFPARQTLADDLSKTLRTVDGYIKELVSTGALKVHQRKRKNSNENYSNLYVLVTANPHAEPIPEVIEVDPLQSTARGVAIDCAETIPTKLHPLSSTSSLHEDRSFTSDESDHSCTHEQSSRPTNPGNLTEEQRKTLRQQLQAIGSILKLGSKFQDDQVQDEWYKFTDLMEQAFPHEYDTTGMADMLVNGKWTVSAKVASPYEAGRELNKIIHTAFSL